MAIEKALMDLQAALADAGIENDVKIVLNDRTYDELLGSVARLDKFGESWKGVTTGFADRGWLEINGPVRLRVTSNRREAVLVETCTRCDELHFAGIDDCNAPKPERAGRTLALVQK